MEKDHTFSCMRLASSKTIYGLFPPSSRVSFFKLGAHCWARSFPTRVYANKRSQSVTCTKLNYQRRYINEVHTDPVKVNFLTKSCLHNSSQSAGAFAIVVGSTLNTPFSKPAFSAKYASVNADKGVPGEVLAIIVHPAAKAALAFRVAILKNIIRMKQKRRTMRSGD